MAADANWAGNVGSGPPHRRLVRIDQPLGRTQEQALRDVTGRRTGEDGEAYERFMDRWSRSVDEVFLHWPAAPPGLRWADVGCGNGAFADLLFSAA